MGARMLVEHHQKHGVPLSEEAEAPSFTLVDF